MEAAGESVEPHVLLIEPFYSGSHKVLMDLLHEGLKEMNVKVHLATLPGKKWHWRARTSALHFSQNVPNEKFTCIFASSVLPLHELLALRSDFQSAKKILYFHENQLVYPVRKSKDNRDFQYGYNQVLSCLVANQVWFNSEFNQESFLSNIKKFFKLQPDFRPKNLREEIEPKCAVKYFPMDFKQIENFTPAIDNTQAEKSSEVLIVWSHRWEFDKNPDLFFKTIYRLVDEGVTNFKISVLGESFTDNPAVFEEAKTKLAPFIQNFGFLPSKEAFYKVLLESHIAVSTADHEFFGVSMMEAAYLGCTLLCPNKLVYPELYDKESLFDNDQDFYIKLKTLIQSKSANAALRQKRTVVEFERYDWCKLKTGYLASLCTVGRDH